jgi:hypothetical protein
MFLEKLLKDEIKKKGSVIKALPFSYIVYL